MLLRDVAPDPQGYNALLSVDDPVGPPWWMPALVHLAAARDDLAPAAREAITAWSSQRHEAMFTVLQEETDDHLSLTGSAWPLVDDRGRLRFRVSDDPVELHAERHELQAFVDAHRARWCELGLVGPEQARAPLRLGDVFAIGLVRPTGARRRLAHEPLRRSRTAAELFLVPARRPGKSAVLDVLDVVARTDTTSGPRRRRIAHTTGRTVDITWDARQVGKVALMAAFAGVLDNRVIDAGGHGTDGLDTTAQADAELITEGIDRQLRAFAAGLAPDEARALGDDPSLTEP